MVFYDHFDPTVISFACSLFGSIPLAFIFTNFFCMPLFIFERRLFPACTDCTGILFCCFC